MRAPKNSFDWNQQRSSLFVRNKRDLMPRESQMAGAVSASPFLFPICPSHGRRSSGTAGYLAEECDACRAALEMGFESQQERFKRLTLVSNSMGPVTGMFHAARLRGCCCSYASNQPQVCAYPSYLHIIVST